MKVVSLIKTKIILCLFVRTCQCYQNYNSSSPVLVYGLKADSLTFNQGMVAAATMAYPRSSWCAKTPIIPLLLTLIIPHAIIITIESQC